MRTFTRFDREITVGQREENMDSLIFLNDKGEPFGDFSSNFEKKLLKTRCKQTVSIISVFYFYY